MLTLSQPQNTVTATADSEKGNSSPTQVLPTQGTFVELKNGPNIT
jgi:hypothetical protein